MPDANHAAVNWEMGVCRNWTLRANLKVDLIRLSIKIGSGCDESKRILFLCIQMWCLTMCRRTWKPAGTARARSKPTRTCLMDTKGAL